MDLYYVDLVLTEYQTAISNLIKAAVFMSKAGEMENDIEYTENAIETLRDRSRLMVAYARDGIATETA